MPQNLPATPSPREAHSNPHLSPSTHPSQERAHLGGLARAFIWLSGASGETLTQCPRWEQRKYVAFGATVLVPAVFALIAASYAVSTLTPDWRVIVPVALIWAFIILSIDRALLATYRSHQTQGRKASQFGLRFGVAMLMGLTISHPLSLLLFKDTITSVVERERDAEIEAIRDQAGQRKAGVESRITELETRISRQRTDWKDTFASSSKPEAASDAELQLASLLGGESGEARRGAIQTATSSDRERIDQIDTQMSGLAKDYRKLQSEIDHWQAEFERELNGNRSGVAGMGPRARSIQEDQLAWRRDEVKRLSQVMEGLTEQRNALHQNMTRAEQRIHEEFTAAASARSRQIQRERERTATLQHELLEQNASLIAGQQLTARQQIQVQMDSSLTDLTRLRSEVTQLSNDEQARVAAIQAEPRRDLLTQTLALHHLFEDGADGGGFALMAYLVLAALFMLVDTIPLIVKFFSKPGPYDNLVHYDEWEYDHARTGGGAQPNKPFDRFFDDLLTREQAFNARVSSLREGLGGLPLQTRTERERHIDDMVRDFYAQLQRSREAYMAQNQAPVLPEPALAA